MQSAENKAISKNLLIFIDGVVKKIDIFPPSMETLLFCNDWGERPV